MTIANTRWQDDAECVRLHATWLADAVGARDTAAARRICARCPVQDECLLAAVREEKGLSLHARYGVRGGASGQARTRMVVGTPWR